MKQRQQWVLGGVMLLALAACGTPQTPSAEQAPTSVSSAAEPSPVAITQVPSAAEVPGVTGAALCDTASLADVQTVTGGNITKLVVGDLENLQYSDCTYMDAQDFSKGMRITFTSTRKLVKTGSPFPDAAAYFTEKTKSGESVAGLGEKAAWVGGGGYSLYVLKGDTVVEFGAPSNDAAVRMAFQTLAQQVVTRLP